MLLLTHNLMNRLIQMVSQTTDSTTSSKNCFALLLKCCDTNFYTIWAIQMGMKYIFAYVASLAFLQKVGIKAFKRFTLLLTHIRFCCTFDVPCVATSKRVIMTCDLCCCLLPQCEAMRTCSSTFPITSKWCCGHDVKVVLVVKRRGCCCNLSVGVVLNVWFTKNGMCAKNNTHIYVAETSNRRVIVACNLWWY